MTFVLIVGLLLELVFFFVRPLWPYRVIGIAGVVASMGAWFGHTIATPVTFVDYILVAIVAFRLIVLAKATKTNIHHDYLQRVTKRSSAFLAASTIVLMVISPVAHSISNHTVLVVLGFLSFFVAILLLAITARNLQKTKHHPSKHFYTDKELPTVTVAIPARNETNDLASCIRTVLANDYPKLEVLVLDDCSQDRTAEIIRDFAHDGVRFIQGDPPAHRWLAKNQAYEKLSHHASGEIILFCGVDVRFGPQAIRSLVTSMLTKKRLMMSVLPFRIGGGVDTSLIQPLRYWWELALPRRMFNRPPVLSTCWLIQRKELKRLGLFKGVSHNILPERFFARELVKSDGYAFVRADEHLDVKTIKPVEEQLKTAVRVRYPSLRKRPENILVLSGFETLFLLFPLALAVSWFWTGATTVSLLGLMASLLLITTHYLIMSASHPMHSIVALCNFPVAVVTEIFLTIVSMFAYEFGKVEWKGRNICIPAMHVVKSLPKLR